MCHYHQAFGPFWGVYFSWIETYIPAKTVRSMHLENSALYVTAKLKSALYGNSKVREWKSRHYMVTAVREWKSQHYRRSGNVRVTNIL